MGSGQYSQDVAHQTRSRGNTSWQGRSEVHPSLDPRVGPREVNNETPIVVALDVTRSRGDDTKKLYASLPKLMDRLKSFGYVDNPGISFAAVGDADADQAPLQVGQFEADNRLDSVLSHFWIEEGGGGTGQESYELAAWYYAHTDCVRLRQGTGKKGYFFFIGDEGYYATVKAAHRKQWLCQEGPDVDSRVAFGKLAEKFHVFLIYPAQTVEERRRNIDAEMRKRVTEAGGQYDNVDVRVTLAWDNRNDLDLHVTTPSGEVIMYSHKLSACGGELDVDRNVQGETTTPVENVRWRKGTAPEGHYRVVVQNYRFHERKSLPTPFRVEVEVGGELLYEEGVISPHGETGEPSNVKVLEFDFAPNATAVAERYQAYSDDVVLEQWRQVLPEGHILRVRDPERIPDVLIGALAIANGRDTLDGYLAKLDAGQSDIRAALRGVVRL